MSAITIDTYVLINTLKEAGVPEQQAKAQIDAIAKFVEVAREQIEHDHKLDDTASKRDLKELELELKRDIAESKAELIRWVVGFGLFQTALITALLLKLSTTV